MNCYIHDGRVKLPRYQVSWAAAGRQQRREFFTRQEADAFSAQLEDENQNIPVYIADCPDEVFVLEYNRVGDRCDEKLIRRGGLQYDEWATLTVTLEDYRDCAGDSDVCIKYGNGGTAKIRRIRMWVPGKKSKSVSWGYADADNTLTVETKNPLDEDGCLQLGGGYEWECVALFRNGAVVPEESGGLVIEIEYFIGSQVGEIVNEGTNTGIVVSGIDTGGDEWVEGLPVDIYEEYLRDPEGGKQNALAKSARRERDRLLAESDNFVLPDRPGGPGMPKAADWVDYRQRLRDVPKQVGFPENVVWPKPPYN